MRGTIRKRTLADGSRRYDCRYRAAGRQRTKSFTRRKDADRFLAELARKVHDGSYVETKPTLMRDVFDAWLADLETRFMMGEVKPSTARRTGSPPDRLQWRGPAPPVSSCRR